VASVCRHVECSPFLRLSQSAGSFLTVEISGSHEDEYEDEEDVAQYRLVKIDRRFRDAYYFHLQADE
jgi:hypothetical protein